jgi:hypothetical protein
MITDLDEQRWVRAAQQGDAEAFAQLVGRHHRGVRACLVARMHDAHEAEDLAQEVFVTAYRKLSEFDPERPAGAVAAQHHAQYPAQPLAEIPGPGHRWQRRARHLARRADCGRVRAGSGSRCCTRRCATAWSGWTARRASYCTGAMATKSPSASFPTGSNAATRH